MELKSATNELDVFKIWEDSGVNLLERIRMNDTEAIVQFVMEHQPQVKAVAQAVLQDEKTATLATRATFKSAVTQIQRGVRTGQVEPWLLWIARNEALTFTQVEQDRLASETAQPIEQMKAATTTIRRFPSQSTASSQFRPYQSGANGGNKSGSAAAKRTGDAVKQRNCPPCGAE